MQKIWSQEGRFHYIVAFTANDGQPAALWNKTIQLARDLVEKLESDGITDATIFEEMNMEKAPHRGKVIQILDYPGKSFKVLYDDGTCFELIGTGWSQVILP